VFHNQSEHIKICGSHSDVAEGSGCLDVTLCHHWVSDSHCSKWL